MKRTGSTLAGSGWKAASVPLACLLLGGCLVTSEKQFEETRNLPPTIVDVPGSSVRIGSIIDVDLEMLPALEFDVRVRDENVLQELEFQHRLVTNIGESLTGGDKVPLSGDVVRDFRFSIAGGDIAAGQCQRLELVVSGSFFDRPDAPFGFVADPDDIARAVWWIRDVRGNALGMNESAAMLATSCPSVKPPASLPMTEELP